MKNNLIEITDNGLNSQEVLKTVVKKEVLPNPKLTYNQENGRLVPKQKLVMGKLTDLLSNSDINSEDIDIITYIIRERGNIELPKCSNPVKQFDRCLNNFKDINPKFFSLEVKRLGELFEDLKNPTYDKVVFNKPTINIHSMKKYVVNYFSNLILDGFMEEKCEDIVNRLENSNDYTKTIYTYTKKGIFIGERLVNVVHNLVIDYKQTNSSGVSNIVGSKTEPTIQKNIYRTIEKDMDLDKSNRLVCPFGATIGEVVNLFPLVKDKNWDLVVNFFEKTPYQSHIDLMYNFNELYNGVRKLQIDYKKYTKNFTNGKHIKFLQLTRTDLNDLERQGIHNIETSIRYFFLSSKVFGSNLSWVNNITQGSFSNDIKKSSKSVLSKLEFGKHILDSFRSVTIENEDFSVIYDKYDKETDFYSVDSLYVKFNGLSMDESTRTDYGNKNFPHREHFKRFSELKSINKISHNYFNYELEEETKKIENLQFRKVEKLMRNSIKPIMTSEVIIHTVSKELSVISSNYTPESETLKVS